MLEITEVKWRELLYYKKSYKFQEKIALSFVVERNVAKALIYIEDLRQSQNQSRHHKK